MKNEYNLPPGSFGYPFIGEAIEQFNKDHLFYWKHYQNYGLVFKSKFMGIKAAYLIGPEANKLVLKDQNQKFSSQKGWSFLEPLLGKNLLLQDGKEHEYARKIINPAFKPQVLDKYFNIIENTADIFLKSLSCGKNIFLYNELLKLTLQIIWKLILGTESDFKTLDLVTKYYYDVANGFRTVVRLDFPLTKYGRAREARRKVQKLLESIIEERKEKKKLNESQIFLDLLINSVDENGNSLTVSKIINQIFGLIYGGHRTTANLIFWSLFELNRHSEWLEKLRDEQFKVIGNEFGGNYLHLKKLKNLSYVIKEVQRLYPSFYIIPREAEEDVKYKNYLIPKGWLIIISPFITHRMPEIYNDPDKFDPFRFAPPREEHKKYSYGFIPFGGGLHKCIGEGLAEMEVKIILSILLARYRWKIIPNTLDKVKFEEINKLPKNARFNIEYV